MCFDHLLVLLRLIHTEVREELAALCNFGEESAAGGIILLVFLQMLRQERDFLREYRDLHMGRPRVLLVRLMLGNQRLFCFSLERHKRNGNMKASAAPPSRNGEERSEDGDYY